MPPDWTHSATHDRPAEDAPLGRVPCVTQRQAYERVQIFSPHPDDVEIFVGGTTLRHYDDGSAIDIVMMTRGERGSRLPWWRGKRLAKRRTSETEARMQRLPRATLRWLDLPDGDVQCDRASIAAVRQAIDDFKPNLIYMPESTAVRTLYRHPDHRATGQIVEHASDGVDATLRYYHTREFNCFVDVSGFETQNRDAIRHFKTQYRISCDPAWLLYRRELIRSVMLRNWGRKNNWKVHTLINSLVAVAHLPPREHTEAFREVKGRGQMPKTSNAHA